ncbi:hypothetical protein AB0D97_28730 [Streptomyces roseus]|uniref:hypothetical protein n=1 Tax=Streptomyces roseus TaxID=66430 RepID=UPI0033C8C25D
MSDDDREFVEQRCMEVGTRAVSGSPLLGLAGLCLGHTARRFGHLGDEALALARSLAVRAETDPADVDGRALDGYDDVRSFLHLWVTPTGAVAGQAAFGLLTMAVRRLSVACLFHQMM